MEHIEIRPFDPAQAQEVSDLIGRSLLELNSKDYPLEDLKDFAAYYNPDHVIALAREGHSFVAMDGDTAVGCASITPYEEVPGQAVIQGFFMLPEYAGKGIGRRLLATLEEDPIFRQADKTVVSASLTAHKFYARFGYRYRWGIPVCEERDHYWMEKGPCPAE